LPETRFVVMRRSFVRTPDARRGHRRRPRTARPPAVQHHPPGEPDDARRVRFARRCGAGRSLLAAWPACTRAAPPRWSGSLRTFRRVMLQGPLQAHIPSGTGLDAPRCRRRTCCRAFAGHG